MKLGIIGVGHLAEAIITGLLRAGTAREAILLAPRGKGPALGRRHGLPLCADNADVVSRSDAVLLAVRPDAAVAAVQGLPFRAGQPLLSACAGVTRASLAAAAPAAAVVRIMPITAASLGASPTLVHPATPAVTALLERIGTVVALEHEDQFEVATVSAAVYGWAQDLIATCAGFAVRNGMDPAAARELTARTFVAAGRMISEQDAPIDELIRTLATPGGITEAGLNTLAARGAGEAWEEACAVVLARLRPKPGES